MKFPPQRFTLPWSHRVVPREKTLAVLHPPLRAYRPAQVRPPGVFPAPTDKLVRDVATALSAKRRSKPGFRDFTKSALMWARLRLGFKTERVVAAWLELELLGYRDRAREQRKYIVRQHLESEAERFFNRIAASIREVLANGDVQNRENRRGYVTVLADTPDGFSSRICFVTVDPRRKAPASPVVICIESESRYKRRLRRGANRRAREYRNQPTFQIH